MLGNYQHKQLSSVISTTESGVQLPPASLLSTGPIPDNARSQGQIIKEMGAKSLPLRDKKSLVATGHLMYDDRMLNVNSPLFQRVAR